MMRKFQKFFIGLLGAVVLYTGLSVGYRALPITHKQERCSDECFLAKLQRKQSQPTADWAKRQIEADFKAFKERTITDTAVARLYEEAKEKVGPQIVHYRILNNRLYKYTPQEEEPASRDTLFERAFKTLLFYTKVPDVDFLLCPMDGIPEAYAPPDFFLASDPKGQVPILGQAKRKEPASQYIVLIPDQFSLTETWRQNIREVELGNSLVPWENKREAAMWRGSLTDVGVPGDYSPQLRECPRFKLSQLSVQFPDRVNAGIHEAESPDTITILSHEHVIRGPASKHDHVKYKYLPVLDGHMCTYPGYQWRLLSNSVAFKQESDQIQWFYGALVPYQHYIPVRNDMSDLLDQIAWAKAHDAEVRAISEQAQKFARAHLMPEDDYLYLLRVFERYATMQNIDFKALKGQMSQDPKWECIQYRKRNLLMRRLRKLVHFVCHETTLKKAIDGQLVVYAT